MAALKDYDARQVLANFLGVNLNAGIVRGLFLRVGRTAPTWRLLKGGDGEAGRLRTRDFSGFCEVLLRSGAGTNNELATILQVDEVTGQGVGPLTITDKGGRRLYFAPLAFIEGQPDAEFLSDGESVTRWRLICDPLVAFAGGSRDA